MLLPSPGSIQVGSSSAHQVYWGVQEEETEDKRWVKCDSPVLQILVKTTESRWWLDSKQNSSLRFSQANTYIPREG